MSKLLNVSYLREIGKADFYREAHIKFHRFTDLNEDFTKGGMRYPTLPFTIGVPKEGMKSELKNKINNWVILFLYLHTDIIAKYSTLKMFFILNLTVYNYFRGRELVTWKIKNYLRHRWIIFLIFYWLFGTFSLEEIKFVCIFFWNIFRQKCIFDQIAIWTSRADCLTTQFGGLKLLCMQST